MMGKKRFRTAGHNGAFVFTTPYLTEDIQPEAVDYMTAEVLRVSTELQTAGNTSICSSRWKGVTRDVEKVAVCNIFESEY